MCRPHSITQPTPDPPACGRWSTRSPRPPTASSRTWTRSTRCKRLAGTAPWQRTERSRTHLGKTHTAGSTTGGRPLPRCEAFSAGSPVFILGGNNAEMRSAGIATTSGVASIHDGAVELSATSSTTRHGHRKPGVPLPHGWEWLYGYLDPDIAYANMMCSPNFPLVGQTAAALLRPQRQWTGRRRHLCRLGRPPVSAVPSSVR